MDKDYKKAKLKFEEIRIKRSNILRRCRIATDRYEKAHIDRLSIEKEYNSILKKLKTAREKQDKLWPEVSNCFMECQFIWNERKQAKKELNKIIRKKND